MIIQIKKLKGFSLIEIIVSLAIVSIILILFFNIITGILNTAIKTNARAAAREEMSLLSNLVRQDIRNANVISDCNESSCELVTNEGQIEWNRCDDNENLVCRYTNNNGVRELTYKMPEFLEAETFSFDVGFSEDTDTTKQNIIFNLAANHTNEELEIENIVVNTSTSTRNYNFTTITEDLIQCGNGILERGEACDDGNNNNEDKCTNACIIPCPYPVGVSSVYSTSGGFCGQSDGEISGSRPQLFCNSTKNELVSVTVQSNAPEGLDDILVLSKVDSAGISRNGNNYIIPEKHVLIAPTVGFVNGVEKRFYIRREDGSLTNRLSCSDAKSCNGDDFRNAGYRVVDFGSNIGAAALENLEIIDNTNIINYKFTHLGAGCGHAIGINLRGNYR